MRIRNQRLKSGDKFSYLTAVKYDKLSKKWLCQCDCGNQILREAGNLTRRDHQKKSCGCKTFGKGHRMPDNLAVKNQIHNSYTTGATRRNITFTLTKEEFFDLISKNCFYCDLKPSTKCDYVGYENDFRYNGIDRVDNTRGYELDNCVPCCGICNYSKNNLSLEEWKNWLKRINKHYIVKLI